MVILGIFLAFVVGFLVGVWAMGLSVQEIANEIAADIEASQSKKLDREG